MTLFKSSFAKGTGIKAALAKNKVKAESSFTPGKGIGASIPVAPAPSPPPFDPQYEGTMKNLTTNRDIGLAGVAAGRETLQRNYGYNLDGSENTSDPYSRLASLRADYEKIKRGSSLNYATRGQLYAGSYQNRVNSNEENNNRSLDALRKDFQSDAAGLTDRETGINAEYNTGSTTAGYERTARAADNVADGTSPVASAPGSRREKVLSALATPEKWKPGHLKNMMKEARKNGWI